MVKVIDYQLRKAEDGREFCTLTVQGGIEMVQSQETGSFYATAKKANITCTFNEETCKMIIGQELQGSIHKVECEPYDYVVPSTAEVIQLTHKYVYSPTDEAPNFAKNIFSKFLNPSKNGALQAA
ncbi:MAG: hypothetical protein U0T69_09215 [Chitinophagales bacterium]